MVEPRVVVTLVLPAAGTALRAWAEGTAAALDTTAAVRCVAADELIGRDLREADRVVVVGTAACARAAHLRELFAQRRARTMAVLDADDCARALAGRGELGALRRNCGRVLVAAEPATAAALQQHLAAAVHTFDPGRYEELAAALLAAPGAPDVVEVHLLQAQRWIACGEHGGALQAAMRALQLSPDQPGIVADVARLLAAVGERDRAAALCASFLRQRPEAAAVLAVARELAAAPAAEPAVQRVAGSCP